MAKRKPTPLDSLLESDPIREAAQALVRAVAEAAAERSLAPKAYTRAVREVERLLRETPLVTLPLWRLGVSTDQLHAIEALIQQGVPPDRFAEYLARRALAERDCERAWRMAAKQRRPRDAGLVYFRALALRLDGRPAAADALLQQSQGWLPDDPRSRAFRTWLGGVTALPR